VLGDDASGRRREFVRLPVHKERDETGVAKRGRYVYLLDVDEDLASEFEMRIRIAVRPVVTARVFDFPRGEFDLGLLFDEVRRGLGLLVLTGLIELDTRVGDRTASELLGSGDLIGPWDEGDALLPRESLCVGLTSTRIAVLDEAFSERIKAWPQIIRALVRREARRSMDLNVQRAATSHPRAEVRVALLLWHLAQRWGKVRPEGVLLPLPLTHRLIGRLVGAERPSVSHAFSRLSRSQLVSRGEEGLLLHGSADHHIACLVEGGEKQHEMEAR
jgi:CRP/FNR family transcriptional regulator, cyclic AMP receptor protein